VSEVETRAGTERAALCVGLVFESLEHSAPGPGEPPDTAVEYEPEATIAGLEAAIERLGHRALRLGAPGDLLGAIAGGRLAGVDVALNIAEGHGSRNREAWAPVLLEMAGIPCLGSDALSLSLTLDKGWANRNAVAAGIEVAPQCVLASAAEAVHAPLPAPFPLFVKPRWEGTSKGIRMTSKVADRAALVREVERIVDDYAQPALVEAFVPGAEYTVTVVGHAPPRALPVLQRALEARSGIGLHALEGPGAPVAGDALDHHVPGELSPALESSLQQLALRAFTLFECLDFARIDFRLDAEGRPRFLEINPLPTFAPDGSFGILAELEGRSVTDLLADVIGEGLERLGLAHPPGR